MKVKINNKDLRGLDINNPDALISISSESNKLLKKKQITKPKLLEAIGEMLTHPDSNQWKNHPLQSLWETVKRFQSETTNLQVEGSSTPQPVKLSQQIPSYPIYGKEQIEPGALAQMDRAMSLPVSIAGALMPDAHEGYGLPIGGVLATLENIVIPYAVGVDIACRMCMSVYHLPSETVEKEKHKLIGLLERNTIFGVGAKNKNHLNSDLFDRPEWNSTRVIKSHRNLAYSQLGTSGAGNHFVEWGELQVLVDVPEVNIKRGSYLALLSHSGSRGFGNEIASYYSKVAMSKIQLPKEAKHLAWLDLASEEGHEYWIAMNLAGEYASHNHREIHQKIARDFNLNPLSTLENHHNFAWKEKLPDGRYAVVHRKGATPASSDAIGIIPGSMTHPGFVVRGKGNPRSLNSASHGAGRSMSRAQALKAFTWSDVETMLREHKVELIGGDIDEIPMAYKNIETVMQLQHDLVEVLAVFKPRIVRMAEPDRKRR